MSRPYLNINSATFSYASDVVTLDITALRMRGQSSITLGGFSASQTINLTNGYYKNSSYTFSAVLDGATAATTASTTYSAATATIVFSGTASKNANVGFTLPGTINVFGNGGYTFSATQSTSDALDLLLATMSFSTSGFSATKSGTSIIFSAPSNTGAYYNGYSVTVQKQSGLGSFTFSYGTSFSNGSTTFALTLRSTDFGTIETLNFTI